MSEVLRTVDADGVCELRLNRPHKRNAITLSMYEALTAALAAAEADDAVRVVLIGGEGAGFCAGNDLKDFLESPTLDAAHPALRFMHGLAGFSKPLVAAVHGRSVGIGVTLLLHCDLVVAARTAELSLPFVALGLVPELGSTLLLPRLVGATRAAGMLLLGDPLDAPAAQDCGLVSRVVEEDALRAESRALAGRLAQQPREALLATRRLLRGDAAAVHACIDAEAQVFGALLASPAFRARVSAFLGGARGG